MSVNYPDWYNQLQAQKAAADVQGFGDPGHPPYPSRPNNTWMIGPEGKWLQVSTEYGLEYARTQGWITYEEWKVKNDLPNDKPKPPPDDEPGDKPKPPPDDEDEGEWPGGNKPDEKPDWNHHVPGGRNENHDRSQGSYVNPDGTITDTVGPFRDNPYSATGGIQHRLKK